MRFKKIIIMAMVSLMSVASVAYDKSNETIKMIVAFPAGSATDAVARIIQNKLNKELGKNVVIEYKLGTAGGLACDALIRANPSDTVLMINSVGFVINSIINSNNACDYTKVQPIALLGEFPFVLVTSTKFGITDLKKWPDRSISYSTSGIGSGGHITGEHLKTILGKDLIHVPYKGVSQSLPDLLSGTIDISFNFPFLVVPYINDGKLLPVAVTGGKRIKELPNVPTFDELGYKNIEGTWIHLFANNSNSNDSQKIQTIIKHAMGDKEFTNELNTIGAQPVNVSSVIPPKNYLNSEYNKFSKILSKIKLEN